MKTDTYSHPFATRICHGLLALFCIAAVPAAPAATPIGQVPVKLSGQALGNRQDIKVSSGNKSIEASRLYSYEISGRFRGENGTPATKVVKTGVSIPVFLESIAPGSSKYLKGSFSNPSGNLPATILDRKIRGKRVVTGLGQVKVSMNLLGTIDKDGICRLEITKVKFKTSKKVDLGSIEFMKGSKLTISAAPVVTFLRTATTVSEDAGSVTVAVRRTTNRHGSVSVHYATIPGTAGSPDYTPTSGTLTFAEGEISKSVTIPIINNTANDGVRRFTVELSDPSAGAYLGSMVSTKIVILDDD